MIGTAGKRPLKDNGIGASILREDLARAGIPYVDERGRIADFHPLRRSFLSLVETDDFSTKVAIARHSDPRLTKHYTDTELRKKAAVIEELPDLTVADSEDAE